MIEQMKPSGIDWIGDIPSAWDVKRIKYVIQNNADGIKVGPFGSALTNEVVGGEEGQYKIYGQANLIRKDFDYGDNYVTEENYRRLINYEVLPEDIAVSMMGTIGKCSVVPYGIKPGIMDSHLIKIRLSNKMLPRFFEYIYESCVVYDQLVVNSKGSIMNGLNSSIVKSVFLAVPSTDEQQVIADFLDAQCSKLDSIIADLEKQIDTLQKYKKSLITETVTKGLDKSAQMKDSGIEWIGQIADKFTVKRLKYMVEIKDGTHDTPDYVEESDTTYPLITSKYIDYDTKTIDFESAKHISKIDFENIYKRSNVEFGDIIMPMIGTIGNPVIVNTEEPFAIKNVALFKTSKNLTNAKYIFYQFYSYMLSEQFNIMARGGVQSFVSLEVLGNLLFVDCSQKEKEAIVNFLDQQCSALDKIIMEKQKELNLLNKHKKSLIYEYVTGKKRVTEVK